jgi:small conductance mechanosensitive channel
MEPLTTNAVSTHLDAGLELLVRYAPRVALALAVLLVGLWLISWLVRVLDRTLTGRAVETTLGRFLTSLAGVTLRILLLITVGSMIGIETTSFVAMLGAAGLAVGLALQGSLSNFAGGVLILLFRPFRAGDYIEGLGVAGHVHAIDILHTRLRTLDNKLVIIPNGPLANAIVTNYSAEATRRIDAAFAIAYRDDLMHAKAILERVAREDARVHASPAPSVVVSALADNAVRLVLRAWVNSADFNDVSADLLEKGKLEFDAGGILGPPTAGAKA